MPYDMVDNGRGRYPAFRPAHAAQRLRRQAHRPYATRTAPARRAVEVAINLRCR
jgi:hypothetical protein